MADKRKFMMTPFLLSDAWRKGVVFMKKRGKSTIFHVIFIVPPKTRCYNHGRNPGQKIVWEFFNRFLCSGKEIF